MNLCRCVPGYTGDHCQLAAGPALPPAAPRPACTRDMCRSIKRCRKQNCGYVARDNRWASSLNFDIGQLKQAVSTVNLGHLSVKLSPIDSLVSKYS